MTRTPEKRATQLNVDFWKGRLTSVSLSLDTLRQANVLPDNVRSEIAAAWYALNRALANLEKWEQESARG